MKILSREQIYKGDKLTAERQNISSTDLMERAGMQIFNWLHLRMQGAQVPVHVFCGIGNNGGDGLVIARHLTTHGYHVKTYVVNYSDKRSKDFLINYERIKQTTKDWPILLDAESELPAIAKEDIIIDAVFGIGLNRPAANWVKTLFQHFRASKAFTLAVDIPSGLYTDKVPEDEQGVVWAGHTLSFQSPKLIFFLPDTAKYTAQWEVLDIGIDLEYLYHLNTQANLIGKHEVLTWYKPREKFSHKGSFGHALIVGGSYGKIGAVSLASHAALASGAGLVTAYVPKCGYIPLQTALPEVMVITDDKEEYLSNITFNITPTVIGLGMGMGVHETSTKALEAFLQQNNTPLVIDADAINILAAQQDLLALLPEQTILTPHPKELERLVGPWQDDFDKLKKVSELSKKYNLIVVVKGANTITVYHENYYVNSTGNPGLATAGTGDVLTGVITGIMAQGYDPLISAIFGIYLHGKSADLQVEDYAYQSMVASHIIEGLGAAYLDLFRQPEQPEQETNEGQQ
ncbi:carbohydrate kinase [Mangrovimonas yunxiaonensis]|uniref:Bifunctional NAD(P)H-hydrate repair enzyme n=1 Tax=Mangrovimonas yunxiaonensis TaxID=1197477 RepID=A0A084THQ5_9FLAO|nr:bifunctional ADP-dependent NAD(P)H-hydrate dehydratase/NAD(P)H-hydrate epimerase [Mangrovimonas yunxiaonensis]KFB00241.1 carbohydrate kinase [Mangrovimonas yunxiaonensis]GGH42791.1 bifunctional NAD(P)H-hydrate repair enzyme [Mangrovimonas yunxiaonensis]